MVLRYKRILYMDNFFVDNQKVRRGYPADSYQGGSN